jgi:hypothetical protein
MYLMKVHHMPGTLVQIMDTVQDDSSLHGCDVDTKSLKIIILTYMNVETTKTLTKILNANSYFVVSVLLFFRCM